MIKGKQRIPDTKESLKPRKARSEASKRTMKDFVRDGKMIHSSKTRLVTARVQELQDKDPKAKVIIYWQFGSTYVLP